MVLGEQSVQSIIKETYISRVKIEVDFAKVNQRPSTTHNIHNILEYFYREASIVLFDFNCTIIYMYI